MHVQCRYIFTFPAWISETVNRMALPMNEALKGNRYNRITDHDYII